MQNFNQLSQSFMEFFLSSYINPFAITFAFFLLLLTLLSFSSSSSSSSSRDGTKTKNRAPPQAGGAWPLIGHLHLLGGPQPPHTVLGNMADKYGPIFTIKMGVHRTLVVSNWEMAKECLTTNDKSFANRPKTLAMDVLGYNGAMFGFSEYSPYWRHIRKIATVELLSSHRLEILKSFRETEVRMAVKEMYRVWEKNRIGSDRAEKVFVEMRSWFGDITLNVIFRMVVGKSVGYSSDESWKQALKDFFDYSGRFVVSDAVPFLRFLDIGGSEKEMKKIAKELDQVVEVWLKEHKERRGEDFMSLMLSLLDQEEIPGGRDPDSVNKATCLALILAASDTTTVTLAWALSLLVNNPNTLKKAQDELDLHVGKERQVQESDVHNLVYLQAIVKETLRLYPAGPLSVPHESLEDCTVAGYHILAKTRLLVNIRKIQRDPRIWPYPDEFRPERFLTTHRDIDFKGQNFEYIPFGSGRRMCPGVSFASHVTHLTLAMLLQSFDFGTISGELVDMIESIGLTNPRATPLEVSLCPRLPSHLYK